MNTNIDDIEEYFKNIENEIKSKYWEPDSCKESTVFSNFWQPDNSYKEFFFNVDISEEVTNRIKNDKKYTCCREEFPNSFIGQKANISVNVNTGKPYILREANVVGKAEFEVLNSDIIVPLFTQSELNELSEVAKEVRKVQGQNNI